LHDYNDIESLEKTKLEQLIGKTLKKVYVHIVDPDFNIVFLEFQDCILEFSGLIGSEMIGLRHTENDRLEELKETQIIKDFEPFDIFLGKEIISVARIGEAWNGHGVEICFKGVYDKTMIIQSIYSGDKPEEFEDCIRLGIGNYFYSFEQI